MKLPDLPLSSLDMSIGLTNALVAAGATTLGQLWRTDAKTLLSYRNMGISKFRELEHVVQRAGFSNPWSKERAFSWSSQQSFGDPGPDWVLLAGPYQSNERWMIENAIACLGPSIDWCVSLDDMNNWLLWRVSKGCKEVEPE